MRFRNRNSGINFGESFHTYRRRVQLLTEKAKHLIPEIEKRGWSTYHIDHVISIYTGYTNGISAEQIADISNLRLVTAEENLKKGKHNKIK